MHLLTKKKQFKRFLRKLKTLETEAEFFIRYTQLAPLLNLLSWVTTLDLKFKEWKYHHHKNTAEFKTFPKRLCQVINIDFHSTGPVFFIELIPKAPFHYYTLCPKDTMSEIPFKSVTEWNFIGTHNNKTPLCIYAWMHQKWIPHEKTVTFKSYKAILAKDSGDMGTQ